MSKYIQSAELLPMDYISNLKYLIERNPCTYQHILDDSLNSGVLKINPKNDEEYILSNQLLKSI